MTTFHFLILIYIPSECDKDIYLKIFFFSERCREGERKGDKHWSVASYIRPLLGTWPTTQAGALTGNQTGNLLGHRPVLNPLSHTNQGEGIFFEVFFLQSLYFLQISFPGWRQSTSESVFHVTSFPRILLSGCSCLTLGTQALLWGAAHVGLGEGGWSALSVTIGLFEELLFWLPLDLSGRLVPFSQREDLYGLLPGELKSRCWVLKQKE